MNAVYDVAVLGAGPAGSIAAYVLAQSGHRVLLLDGALPNRRVVGESLPSIGTLFLRNLDLLHVLTDGGHDHTYGNHSAWGSSQLQATDFIGDPHGLGWHLNRKRFDADLRQAAIRAGAELRQGQARHVAPTPDGYTLSCGTAVAETSWLIDASGRGAKLARQLSATRSCDDDLVALYCWVKRGKNDVDTRTLVESAPDGWWYTSRLPEQTRIVVFHTTRALAATMIAAPDLWQSELAKTEHVRGMVAGSSSWTALRQREACGSTLDRYFGERWIAVGDAAIAFDPLSAQGIFNALHSGWRAGQAVSAALAGRTPLLEQYAIRLETIRATYLARHRLVYALERRWSDRPFWRSRTAWRVSPSRSGAREPSL